MRFPSPLPCGMALENHQQCGIPCTWGSSLLGGFYVCTHLSDSTSLVQSDTIFTTFVPQLVARKLTMTCDLLHLNVSPLDGSLSTLIPLRSNRFCSIPRTFHPPHPVAWYLKIANNLGSSALKCLPSRETLRYVHTSQIPQVLLDLTKFSPSPPRFAIP